MIIYKDIFTGDEMFSDTFKDITVKDDLYYEVKAKTITETTEVSDSVFGGNPSEEAGDDEAGADPSSVSGLNVVIIHKLKPTTFNRETYTTHIKAYAKKLKAKLAEENPERVAVFEAGMPAFTKNVLLKKNFKKFDFYTGESENPDGLTVLLTWGDDENTPTFMFLKDGIVAEKV